MDNDDSVLRLNKFVSQSGLCNRKQAVDLIKKGEILVNGKIEIMPFYEVKDLDIISYKGKQIVKKVKLVYLLLNKPKNMALTIDDNNIKPAVEDIIKKTTPVKLKPAGVYTFESAGLMIMTNDEELIEKISSSTQKVKYVYEIELNKEISDEDLLSLNVGSEDKHLLPRMLGVNLTSSGDRKKLGVEMIGGSEIYIQNIFNMMDYTVVKKDCTFIGGLTKKDLKRGWSRLLTEKEIIFLKHFS